MMPKICEFTVMGHAVPQGSTRLLPVRTRQGETRTILTHSNRAGLLQWRADIRAALQSQLPREGTLLRGPVAVRVRFLVTKPPSVSKRRLYPTVAPDLDKLCRAVGDALESTVLATDAQIVGWEAWKVYTTGPAQASITLWTPEHVVQPASDRNPFQEALF